MKRNRKHNLLGWLAASTLLLTTACAGISDLDMAQKNDGGPTTVTFTIQPQSMASGMRASGDLNTRNTIISEGDSIDVLIFAVYKVTEDNGKTKYEIVEKYGKDDQTKNGKFTKNDGTSLLTKGQTAIDANKTDYPMTLQFLMEGEDEYQVAFWAQCSETDAYDTRDMAKVEVKYSTTADGKTVNYLNNTERRDAFCAVSQKFTAKTKQTEDIILRRPLAQVNVGTTGWDYEGAAVLRPGSVSYTQSTMTLKGVAKYYNVLEKRTLAKNDLVNGESATTDVTFDYFRLPAFINVPEKNWKYPQIHPFYQKTSTGDSVRVEEFLTIDLNKDNDIDSYVGWTDYDQYRKDKKEDYQAGKLPATEQFKYLSMCYILVPEAPAGTEPEASQVEAKDHETEIENDNKSNASTVNVEFSFKGTERTDNGAGAETTFKQSFRVNNVPVQKNWRTNLLSKKGIFTYSTNFILDIVPEYCGDHNYNYNDGEWHDKENQDFEDKNEHYEDDPYGGEK